MPWYKIKYLVVKEDECFLNNTTDTLARTAEEAESFFLSKMRKVIKQGFTLEYEISEHLDRIVEKRAKL